MEVEESDQEFNRKLEELKRDMDAIPFEPKSEDELRRMLHASGAQPAASDLQYYKSRPARERNSCWLMVASRSETPPKQDHNCLP